ncbi:MAG: hypothetical protein IRY97_02065 [Thermomicrobiaceae bacterium]|nr:hypothetical protein [Thermomicrobiaceae bacterium]
MATHGHPVHGTTQRTWDLTPQEIIADSLRKIRAVGSTYRLALIVTAILAVLGIVGLVLGPIASGWGDRQAWTYAAVTFGWLMSTVGAAPLPSVASRLARGHWRRPVNRASELWGAAMIVPFILFLFLEWALPGTKDHQSIWFGWKGSPWLWDTILMLALVVAGYAFLYVGALPDIAVARDQLKDGNNGRFAWLARDWQGRERQWQVVQRAVGLLGVFYVMLYVATMTVMASDLIMAMIPGYNSAIFPALYTVSAIESGIATLILTIAVLRRWGGFDEYLEHEQFFALAKLQLALGLLWFYFTWTDFIIYWYGREPQEIAILKLLYFGPYAWAFYLAFALNFLTPLFVLMWTRIRKSIAGPIVAAVGVVIGNLMNQIRFMSSSFSVANINQRALLDVPAQYLPNLWDILILVGWAGASVAVVLLAVRFVPYPSVWEVTAGLRLRARRRYAFKDVFMIGKPE